ncbi:MAG: DNA alkylation repair protein [Xanthomonadaceae bacterium]|nr:DNA alkylation repair protein [Xanthomonadaceae bacterium]
MSNLLPIQKKLRTYGSKERALHSMRFFKTGPGQYGEGDQFLGATVPELWNLTRTEGLTLSEKEITRLIQSPIHEDRLLGLMSLVLKYQKTKLLEEKSKIVAQYLKNKKGINNWDLVDLSCYKLLGDYCLLTNDSSFLKKLSDSTHHWDKRIAMVSTLAFIRVNKLDLTFEFAKKFLDEEEDLMHKAAGWMLREAGKRDLERLRKFIAVYGKKMPRTMLRYSIEKMTLTERKKILKETKP